jgi:hypothetical protein
MSLFELEPDPALEAAAAEAARVAALSPDRRRTERQRRDVEAGRHPLMGSPTRPELGTCGDCVHRVLVGYHSRTYPKCDAAAWPSSHSPTSDCRAWWPACDKFEPRASS